MLPSRALQRENQRLCSCTCDGGLFVPRKMLMVGNVNNLRTGVWPLISCWRNWSGTFEWLANGIPHTCSVIGWRENESVRQPSGTPKWSSAFNVPLPVVFLQLWSQLYHQPPFFRPLQVWQELRERANFHYRCWSRIHWRPIRCCAENTGLQSGFTAEQPPATYRGVTYWIFLWVESLLYHEPNLGQGSFWERTVKKSRECRDSVRGAPPEVRNVPCIAWRFMENRFVCRRFVPVLGDKSRLSSKYSKKSCKCLKWHGSSRQGWWMVWWVKLLRSLPKCNSVLLELYCSHRSPT